MSSNQVVMKRKRTTGPLFAASKKNFIETKKPYIQSPNEVAPQYVKKSRKEVVQQVFGEDFNEEEFDDEDDKEMNDEEVENEGNYEDVGSESEDDEDELDDDFEEVEKEVFPDLGVGENRNKRLYTPRPVRDVTMKEPQKPLNEVIEKIKSRMINVPKRKTVKQVQVERYGALPKNAESNVFTPRVDRNQRYGQEHISQKLSECIAFFRQPPWFKDIVLGVFIDPINVPSNTYDINRFKTLNGKKYYQVTKNYYSLRCDTKNTYFGDEQDIVLDNKYNFRLAFDTKTGMVPFDYSLFSKESTFHDEHKKRGKFNLGTAGRGEVTTTIYKNGYLYISEFVGEKRAKAICDDIMAKSRDAQSFANQVALIYCAAKLSDVFRAKLTNNVYKDDMLTNLGVDMLFEGLLYKNYTEVIESYVNDVTVNILSIPPTGMVRVYRKNAIVRPKIWMVNPEKVCKNYEAIRGLPLTDVVYYEERPGDVECFQLSEIYKRFSNKNYKNPNSGRNFNQDFINKVLRLHTGNQQAEKNKDLFKEEDLKTQEEEDDISGWIRAPRISRDEVTTKRKKVDEDAFQSALNDLVGQFGNLNTEMTCEQCKQKYGKNGIKTLNRKGEEITFCSKKCFNKYK